MELPDIAERFRQEGNTKASLVIEKVLELVNMPESELEKGGQDLVSLCVLLAILNK